MKNIMKRLVEVEVVKGLDFKIFIFDDFSKRLDPEDVTES